MLSSNVNNFLPVTVRTYTYDVGVKVAQIIAENRDLYPGVYVAEQAMRSYPNGYYLGHVLGSVGTITQSQYDEEGELYGYDLNAIVGKKAVWKSIMNTILRTEKKSASGGKMAVVLLR